MVKEFASLLYGQDNFIRLDMSEYKEEHSISKIIGAPPGYVGFENHFTILDHIRMHPHSVLLLDEIEKASPAILKLFLQVMDEGYLKDSKGRKIRFDNVFLFMTTNLGSRKDHLGFTIDKNEKNEELESFLSVEFVNRIDKLYTFKNLDEEALRKIVSYKIGILINAFKKKNIEVILSPKIVDKILERCEYDKFGARRVDKVIDDMVTPLIVDAWYRGEKKVTI